MKIQSKTDISESFDLITDSDLFIIFSFTSIFSHSHHHSIHLH